jgi:hypothetical protein
VKEHCPHLAPRRSKLARSRLLGVAALPAWVVQARHSPRSRQAVRSRKRWPFN